MGSAKIELPSKLIPVFSGKARYRGAYGGRGSGKTRSFALMAALKGYQLAMANRTGVILCAREFMNSLSDSSMAEVKSAIVSVPWMADYYDIGSNYIRTKNRRIEFLFAGLRHNIDSIKSKAKIHLCWVDEAEPVSEIAWQKLIPTIREKDSEIWVTWNPERETSATHKRFRASLSPDMKIIEMNWRDNPWFPEVLEQARQDDLQKRPDYYHHIWEGGFIQVIEGAYFARELNQAKQEGRIGNVALDPLLPLKAFWDLGGSGARADATAIWIAQFVGREIRLLDHYEAQGQPLSAHLVWLRQKKYDQALQILPHDGATSDRIHNVSFRSALEQAGFTVEVVPNQGAGAARLRIEAARRLFPQMWFNKEKTKGGLEALSWYHEKRDAYRNIGLGPAHDWASHSADAFGLMAVYYEEPSMSLACQYHRSPFVNEGGWESL